MSQRWSQLMECCLPACLYLMQRKDNISEWWHREEVQQRGAILNSSTCWTCTCGDAFARMHGAGRSTIIISSPFKLNSHPSLCLMSFCMDSTQIPHHSLNRLELLMKQWGKNGAAAGARGLFFRAKEKKVRGYGLEIGTSLFHCSCQDRTNDLARCFQLEEQPEQH